MTNNDIDKAYMGVSEVDKIYLGDALIYPTTPPPTPSDNYYLKPFHGSVVYYPMTISGNTASLLITTSMFENGDTAWEVWKGPTSGASSAITIDTVYRWGNVDCVDCIMKEICPDPEEDPEGECWSECASVYNPAVDTQTSVFSITGDNGVGLRTQVIYDIANNNLSAYTDNSFYTDQENCEACGECWDSENQECRECPDRCEDWENMGYSSYEDCRCQEYSDCGGTCEDQGLCDDGEGNCVECEE